MFILRRVGIRGICMGIFAVFLVSVMGCYQGTGESKYARRSMDYNQKSTVPVHHEFQDVLVPGELKVNQKSTFIYRASSGFSAGVLTLSGRVEMNSLVEFFKNNMPKEGWTPISSFRSSRSLMLFNKDNKWCVISIQEKEFSTVAEIWVAPTMGAVDEGLYK